MKRFLLLLFCALSFSLAAQSKRILTGTVLWIVDGDTILLRRGDKLTSIRLWGIDAPEKRQSGGKAATRYLIELIGRKRVKVVATSSDKYGRIIGKVYYKDKFINLEMVKAGYAWWYERYCPDANDFKAAEMKARKNRSGLWQESNPVRPEYFRRLDKKRKAAVIDNAGKSLYYFTFKVAASH